MELLVDELRCPECGRAREPGEADDNCAVCGAPFDAFHSEPSSYEDLADLIER
jgi:rubrerythrin